VSALCAQADPEAWFAYAEFRRGTHARRDALAYIKGICAACSLMVACRDYGLETRQPYGVWGGLDEDDRETVLKDGADATRASLRQVVEIPADPVRSEDYDERMEARAA
jgi:WhiB family redox-sensing transcriptional regulator